MNNFFCFSHKAPSCERNPPLLLLKSTLTIYYLVSKLFVELLISIELASITELTNHFQVQVRLFFRRAARTIVAIHPILSLHPLQTCKYRGCPI